MNNVVNLRETQRTSKLNINSKKINVNDIVLVYDKMEPRHFWRIDIVTGLLPHRDSEIRGAIVRMAKTNIILKGPLNSSQLKIHLMTLTKQIRQANKS